MSEEFSTDELIYALDQDRGSFESVLTNNEIDAIIARLRAADKLCAQDKKMMVKIAEGTGITLGEMAEWAKAIAEYEGEK